MARAREYYVSPDGHDNNPGTLEKPFATLLCARDILRKSPPTETTTVWVRKGTYSLSEPLQFLPEDSGAKDHTITYAAYPGEEVILKGSAVIHADWKPYKNGIYVCSLKGTALDGQSTNQLYCNNKRMVRGRFPNWDFKDPSRRGQGYLVCKDGNTEEMFWRTGQLDNKQQIWSSPQTGILHAFHNKNWGNMMYRIKDIDWQTNRVLLGNGGWQCQRSTGPGVGRGAASPYYIENIFEEVDAPHEWFIDTEKNLLYFYPPAGVDIHKALIEAAILPNLIEFSGSQDHPVHHLCLRGFHMTQSQATFMEPYEDLLRGDWSIHHGGTIFLKGAEDCQIEDCRIEQVGGNGIFHSGYNQRIDISGCLIENIGDSAVCYVGSNDAVRHPWTWATGGREGGEVTDIEIGPKTDNFPRDCSVRNSILRNVGVYGKQTSGVLVSKSMNITISHCTIHGIPRAGITFNDGTWGGHILEHCDIWDTVTETGEHGPFNGWGRDRFWTGLKKDFVLLDAFNTVHIRNNRIANLRPAISAGNWTIDLDDGCSNYHIYNNLSLGSTLKLRDGYYRNVYNNIHVSAVPLGWHCWPAQSEDVFGKNITVIAGAVEGTTEPQEAMIKAAGTMTGHPWGKRHGDNLWWNVNTKEFVVQTKGQGSVNGWSQWQKLGYGEGSVLAEPMFIDPAAGDFRVKPDSPALKLGFKNFPMDQFGHEMTRIEVFGRDFETETTVTLRPDIRGGRVFFTLDGSWPTTESLLYEKPIVLRKTTTVRAQTFLDDMPVGFEAQTTFTKVDTVRRPSWLQTLLAGKFIEPNTSTTKAGHGQEMKTESFQFDWLGAVFINIDDPDLIDALGGEEKGAYVSGLSLNSLLRRHGLRKGDLIKRINAQEIENAMNLKKAIDEIAKDRSATYSLEIFRDYQIIKIDIQVNKDTL
jgi:hypothetical protein